MNYLIILGLRRHGRDAEADRLKSLTIEHVLKDYEKHGVVFEFYDPTGRQPPTLLDRKGKNLGEYDIRRKIDCIRDYHGTAAVTACLLLE